MSAARCDSCGAPLRPGARFCGGCGSSVGRSRGAEAAPRADVAGACPACGHRRAPTDRYCGRCGHALEPAAAGQSPSASTAPSGTVAPQTRLLHVLPGALRDRLAERSGSLPEALWLDAEEPVLAQVQRALRRRGDALDAVCLVGDAQQIPLVKLDDPCGYDEALLSDAPYGMRQTPSAAERMAGDVLPEIPVTRIPLARGASIERLLALGAGALPVGWDGGLAVSAAVWRRATAEVLGRIGAEPQLILSPPDGREQIGGALSRRPRRMLFNLHGSDQDPAWFGEGEGRYPEALRAEDLAVGGDALVISEACYGATLREGERSLAPAFFAAGASGFIGSTIIAWGSARDGPPQLADELVEVAWRAIDEGYTVGQALQQARIELVQRALERDGGLSAPLHNTLLSFSAYGAPRATSGPRAAPRSATPATPPVAPRSAPAAPAAGRADPLAAARDRLRRRLDPDDWHLLSSARATIAEVGGRLRGGALALRTLERLLGGAPAEARVIRYGGRRGAGRVSLLGHRAHRGRRLAGVDLGAGGSLLASYVSR